MDNEPYVSGTGMVLMFVAVLQGHSWAILNGLKDTQTSLARFMSTSRMGIRHTPNQSLSFWFGEQFLEGWQGKTTAAGACFEFA